jgi:hypothetical protein
MILATRAQFLLPGVWPAWLVVIGLGAAVAGWVFVHRLRRASAPADAAGRAWRAGRQYALLGARLLLALACCYLFLDLLGKAFVLTTNWPIWVIAAIGAVAGVGLVGLYEVERQAAAGRTGRVLTGLRLAMLGLVLVMLAQPVYTSEWSRSNKRSVAVLVDVSASMLVSDGQMPVDQRLKLAEAFSIPCAQRAVRLEGNAQDVRALAEDAKTESAWLDRLAAAAKTARAAELTQRRSELNGKLSAIADKAAEQAKALEPVAKDSQVLPPATRLALLDALATLKGEVAGRLKEGVGWTSDSQAPALEDNFDRLREAVRRSGAGLAKAAPILDKVGQDFDKAHYAALKPADKSVVDAMARFSRLDVAKAALLHKLPPDKNAPKGDSLLDRLKSKVGDVRVYTFATDAAVVNPKAWADPIAAAAREAGAATSLPAAGATTTTSAPTGFMDAVLADKQAMRTDLSGALRKVLADMAGRDLSGVVVLTEGRDNGKDNPESPARQLGGDEAAFCAIMLGSDTPPVDAAIVSVDAPDTVYLSDKVFIDTKLKLDGLSGKDVVVHLYAGAEEIDAKTVRPATDSFRASVVLSDEPKQVGPRSYRVEIKPLEGEAFVSNNAYDLTVAVSDDHTKVLLVDDRPRWEFRYLKNLFSGRDKSVRLQYVLFSPDQFEGQPKVAKPVPACATRPAGQEEADALPANAAEWAKFDVVILGDVAPGQLTPEGMQAIRKFVTDGGGTVILVAGQNFMPGAYAGTGLAELIPLKLAAPAPKPTPRAGFRWALTADGRDHIILRQDPDPDKSMDVWASIPPLYWRSQCTEALPTGIVLAYCLEDDAPAWLAEFPSSLPANVAATTPEGVFGQREAYQRRHALLTVAPSGLGKVMVLTSDQSWRLRYGTGDPYHHKFWGQALRWATSGKLPAGTSLVKLGSDRTRYSPHDRPVVRAKIVREDLSPVITDQVAVKVFQAGGDQLVGKAPMKYLKDSPGMYSATLDELPSGAYRLELDAPAAAELLARDGVKSVATEISVDPAAPAELIELSANRELLARLAALSHNGIVVGPQQAARVVDALQGGDVTLTNRYQFLVWDSWPLLLLFVMAATAEWLLRKRAGLV